MAEGPASSVVFSDRLSGSRDPHARLIARVTAALLIAALPLVGFVSLLLRSQLDPHFENYGPHFVVFGIVGGVAFLLGYTAGEAANRRGDARVLLLSLAFMATGGFLGLHAIGTRGVLFSKEYAGFQVAIPVGLLVSAVFAVASAFVDIRPGVGAELIRRRTLLRVACSWHGRVVHLDGCRAATAARAEQRGGDRQARRRDRGRRDARVRGERRAVLEDLPHSASC